MTVLSVSFVTASRGWLLATPCANQPRTCRTVVVRETADGGRSWFPVSAPSAPPADVYQSSPPAGAVGTILFTSGGRGWAFGPALWQTTDGGATWRRVNGPGGQVQDVAVDAGRVLALTERCRPCRMQVYAAPVYAAAAGTDDWRAVPGASSTGARNAVLAVSGADGYLAGPSVLLGGSVNGRWHPLPFPCRGDWTAVPAAAAGGLLFLGCAAQPGAGSQLKAGYLSADGGHTWHQVTAPPDDGYLGSASMSPAGTILLSGDRMDIYLSWDRGRSWHESPSLAGAAATAGAGFPLTGSILTGTFGYAFQQSVVWLTRDGGHTWTSVTIH